MFKKNKKQPIEFDEIFLDSSNLPAFNKGRMEGKFELPMKNQNILIVGIIFILIAVIFFSKLFILQVVQGELFRSQSENNRINNGVIIAERGVVYDRNKELLAWNETDYKNKYDFPVRAYSDRNGLGQIIGYVSYPQKDKKGFYFRTDYLGRNGIEEAYNKQLSGINGRRLIEEDALGNIVSEYAVDAPEAGKELILSIDAGLSDAMYNIIATTTANTGFRSGAAAIMDVHTGEILAMTSFPSYDPEILADGDNVEMIKAYNNDPLFPFLNKVIGGVYTPGSIVKPFMAYAALAEKIISPEKIIVSNGQLVIPNPYHPNNPTIFKDWRVQGAMTMKEAIAYSSNVYFYIIGGGFQDQEGLGIARINKYMKLFGFGTTTGIALQNELYGTIPSPEWKKKLFDEDWRLGDTYHTSIGQYGFGVTPLQMLRAYAAIANGGTLFTPHFIKNNVSDSIKLDLNENDLNIVREGMLMTTNYPRGTARPLERKDVKIAAKSGTAELGKSRAYVNSWAVGFFPYENPKYSFVMLMEHAPRSNTVGATKVMGYVFDWISKYRSEYIK